MKKKSKENKIKNYAAYFINLCSKVSGLKRNSDNCHKKGKTWRKEINHSKVFRSYNRCKACNTYKHLQNEGLYKDFKLSQCCASGSLLTGG